MSSETFYKVGDLKGGPDYLLAPASDVAAKGTQELLLAAPDTPREFQELGLDLGDTMRQMPNVVIAYSFNSGRDEPTYRFERYPERFTGRLAVVSLDNFAYAYSLVRAGSKEPSRANCVPGTVLLVDADLRHVDSPPLEGPIRRVLLFGYDPTKKHA